MAPTEEDVSTVVVIDDDLDVRNGLEHRLGSVGLREDSFLSVRKFEERARPIRPECIVLDARSSRYGSASNLAMSLRVIRAWSRRA